MAITPFKVIQGHHFWYHLNARIAINLHHVHPIMHRLRDIADCPSNFRYL